MISERRAESACNDHDDALNIRHLKRISCHMLTEYPVYSNSIL